MITLSSSASWALAGVVFVAAVLVLVFYRWIFNDRPPFGSKSANVKPFEPVPDPARTSALLDGVLVPDTPTAVIRHSDEVREQIAALHEPCEVCRHERVTHYAGRCEGRDKGRDGSCNCAGFTPAHICAPVPDPTPKCNGPSGDEEDCPVHGAEIRAARARVTPAVVEKVIEHVAKAPLPVRVKVAARVLVPKKKKKKGGR